MSRDDVEQRHAADVEDWRRRIADLKDKVDELNHDAFEILEAAHQSYHQKLDQLGAATGAHWEAVKVDLDHAKARLERAWERVLELIG